MQGIMEKNLEDKTKKFMERFVGRDLAKKESLSILDTMKLVGIVIPKIVTPIYGDKLMIDGTRLAIEEEPQHKNLYLASLGVCLIGKYISIGSAIYNTYPFLDKLF